MGAVAYTGHGPQWPNGQVIPQETRELAPDAAPESLLFFRKTPSAKNICLLLGTSAR